MRFLIELSGESRELASAEALALGRAEPIELDDRAMVINCDMEGEALAERLGLAWSVSRHLFSCDQDELDAHLEGLAIPGSTFRVRVSRMGGRESPGSGLAAHAGEILGRKYVVDLEGPGCEVRILAAERMHVGTLVGEVDRPAMEARKSENRPFSHPISLHPKFARAMVNLTGIMPGQTLLDPFCGTGGILLEAGLMGCRVLGGDMDPRMVKGSILNLEHYGIAEHDIRLLDVAAWPETGLVADAIATDPPYGRSASTAKEPIEELYKRAFAACHAMLRDGAKMSIALPSKDHARDAEGFELEGVHPVRVHRSLTRHFCVMRKIS